MIVIWLYSLVNYIMPNKVYAWKSMSTGQQMYKNNVKQELKDWRSDGNQPDTYNLEMALSHHFPKLKTNSLVSKNKLFWTTIIILNTFNALSGTNFLHWHYVLLIFFIACMYFFIFSFLKILRGRWFSKKWNWSWICSTSPQSGWKFFYRCPR